MKNALQILFMAMLLPCIAIAAPTNTATLTAKQQAAPLLFTENRGQVADVKGQPRPDILFTAYSHGTQVYLTAAAIHYQFTHIAYPAGFQQDEHKVKDRALQEKLRSQAQTSTDRFTLSLAGANPNPHIRREEKSSYFENFYLPQCPSGITGVATYSRLVYEEVYPGIDWIIYSNGSSMKYDFLVKPGADPAQIKLQVSDALNSIAKDGSLELKSQLGIVTEAPPVSYAGNSTVATSFITTGGNTYSFHLANWDRTKALRIDPSITWSTYYGGSCGANCSVSGYDYGQGCAADAAGNVYLTGVTNSTSGIAGGGFQNSPGPTLDGNAFLVKFAASGARLWGTFYGGGNGASGYSCAADNFGNIFMAGLTASADLIASTNSFQGTYNGSYDAFLVKFNSAGARTWGTYYGGTQLDYAQSCMADAAGNVYLAGASNSADYIASANFQSTYVSGYGFKAFLAKFDSSGNRQWGRYYSADYSNFGQSLSMDAAGNIYMGGYSGDGGGIVPLGGFSFTYGTDRPDNYNAFISKFTNDGNLTWATPLGTSFVNGAVGTGCAADSCGNVFLTGYTNATAGIATTGAYQTAYAGDYDGYGDAFLAKYAGTGSLLWATYYGFANDDLGYGCTTDRGGNVYLSGAAGDGSFIVKFSDSGSRIWDVLYGVSSGYEHCRSFAADKQGNVYMAGSTNAAGVAFNGYQNTYGGTNSDAFLTKVKVGYVTLAAVPQPLCPGTTVSIPYYANDTLNAGNVFSIQLSDSVGSFAAPVTIGSYNAVTSGSISSTIPANTLYGTGYKIRVLSSSPADTGNICCGFTINTSPAAQTITASGPLAFCAGDSVLLTVPITTGYSYSWLRNNSIIAGATANSYIATLSGSYKVIVSSPCGMDTSNTDTVVVTDPPATPGGIAGNPNPCAGATATFFIAPVTGASSYTWTLPAGWSGSSTGTSISVTAGTTGGTISLTASNGCVSGVRNLTVTAKQPPATPDITGNTSVCANSSQTYSVTAVTSATSYTWALPSGWNGSSTGVSITTTTGTTGGTVSVTANNACGTSAAQTLDVTVQPAFATSFNASVCNGQSYTFGGTNYTATGAYTHTFTSSTGCDSTATLHLIVAPLYNTTLNANTCQGTAYDFGGSNYNTAGTYVHTFTTATGCDSTVTLHLAVGPVYNNTLNIATCQGTPYSFGGSSYNTTGIYAHTFTSATGCDSTVTLHLTVNPTYNNSVSASFCQGTSYFFGGTSYTTAGTYLHTFTTTSGCDSVVTLQLSINPVYNSTINVSLCQGTSYTFAGTVYTASGTYPHVFTSVSGCDSTVTLHLTVNPVYSTTLNAATCQGTPYSFGGNNYSTAGTYPHTFISAYGCDSTVTLILVVNAVYMDTIAASTCQGTAYSFAGNSYTTAGTYSHTFTSSTGCDSIVTLQLTVNALPVPAISFQSPLLTATSGYSSYQWLYNGTTPVGINADTLTATQNGTYTVTATDQNGCTGTSAIYTVAGLSIANTLGNSGIKIYPNPANNILYIEQSSTLVATVTVTDAAGKLLLRLPPAAFSKQQLNITGLAPGLYLLRLATANGESVGFKFTKQ